MRTQFSDPGRKGFLQRLAVGRELDRAGEPGLNDASPDAAKPGERFGVRVSVLRQTRRGYHGKRRTHGVEKRLGRRAAAPVVRHLEHVGVDRPPGARREREEPALGALLDVAGQQEGPPAEDDAKHERAVVVARLLAVRPEHLDPRAADLERVARAHVAHRDAGRREATAKLVETPVAPGHEQRAPDAHAREDGAESARVVDVAVARDYVVEPRDAERPERLADDTLADVEPFGEERTPLLEPERRVETRTPARVDEHRLARRKPHERRVALADVEEEDMKPPVARGPGRGRREDPDRREREYRTRDRRRAPRTNAEIASRRHGMPPRHGPGQNGERKERDPRSRRSPSDRRRRAPPGRRERGRAGRECERGAHHGHERRSERRRHGARAEEREPGHERDSEPRVDRERRERARRGDPVEVDDRERHERHLHDGRDPERRDQVPHERLYAKRVEQSRRGLLRDAESDGALALAARETARAPEERLGRREQRRRAPRRVGAPPAREPPPRVGQPFERGRGQQHDRRDRRERELEARVSKRRRVPREHDERRDRERVRGRRAACDERRRERHRERERGADDGRRRADRERIEPHGPAPGREPERGRARQPTGRPEQQRRDERDVRARDHEYVKSAGGSINLRRLLVEPRSVAEQQRAQQPRLARREGLVDPFEPGLTRPVERGEHRAACAGTDHLDRAGVAPYREVDARAAQPLAHRLDPGIAKGEVVLDRRAEADGGSVFEPERLESRYRLGVAQAHDDERAATRLALVDPPDAEREAHATGRSLGRCVEHSRENDRAAGRERPRVHHPDERPSCDRPLGRPLAGHARVRNRHENERERGARTPRSPRDERGRACDERRRAPASGRPARERTRADPDGERARGQQRRLERRAQVVSEVPVGQHTRSAA